MRESVAMWLEQNATVVVEMMHTKRLANLNSIIRILPRLYKARWIDSGRHQGFCEPPRCLPRVALWWGFRWQQGSVSKMARTNFEDSAWNEGLVSCVMARMQVSEFAACGMLLCLWKDTQRSGFVSGSRAFLQAIIGGRYASDDELGRFVLACCACGAIRVDQNGQHEVVGNAKQVARFEQLKASAANGGRARHKAGPRLADGRFEAGPRLADAKHEPAIGQANSSAPYSLLLNKDLPASDEDLSEQGFLSSDPLLRGAVKKPQPPRGCIAEFEKSEIAKKLLEDVTHSAQRAWLDSYDEPLVSAELKKAHAWIESNPKRRPRAFAKFFANWLARAHEIARKQIPIRPAVATGDGAYIPGTTIITDAEMFRREKAKAMEIEQWNQTDKTAMENAKNEALKNLESSMRLGR